MHIVKSTSSIFPLYFRPLQASEMDGQIIEITYVCQFTAFVLSNCDSLFVGNQLGRTFQTKFSGLYITRLFKFTSIDHRGLCLYEYRPNCTM